MLVVNELLCTKGINFFWLIFPKLTHCFPLSFKAVRKKYEKETEKYYSSLEKLLNMSAKKKEPQLQEVFILASSLCLPKHYDKKGKFKQTFVLK